MLQSLLILLSLLPNLLAAEKAPLPVYRSPVEFIYPALPSCKKFSTDGCCKPSGIITVSYPAAEPEVVEAKKKLLKRSLRKQSQKSKKTRLSRQSTKPAAR